MGIKPCLGSALHSHAGRFRLHATVSQHLSCLLCKHLNLSTEPRETLNENGHLSLSTVQFLNLFG